MNGTQWLEEWKVDTAAMRPVILQNLVMHHVSLFSLSAFSDLAWTQEPVDTDTPWNLF